MIGREALIALPKGLAAVETIVLRGLVLADLGFKPLAMYSARVPGNWPRPAASDYYAELRDASGRPLNCEYLQAETPLICSCPPPRHLRLDGAIALREGAAKLLLFKQDIQIAEFPVGPAPSLSLGWDVKRGARRGRHELRLKYSPPLPDAFIQAFYEPDEKGRIVLARLAPQPALKIAFSSLPGGSRCRLAVAYTSGLRTVVRRTGTFSLPEIRQLRKK